MPNPLDSGLSFTHFRLAATASDPVAAIAAAHDSEWTVEQFAAHLRSDAARHGVDGHDSIEPRVPASVTSDPNGYMAVRPAVLEPSVGPQTSAARLVELEAVVRARPEFADALARIAKDEAEASRLEAKARTLRQRARQRRSEFDSALRDVLTAEKGAGVQDSPITCAPHLTDDGEHFSKPGAPIAPVGTAFSSDLTDSEGTQADDRLPYE